MSLCCWLADSSVHHNHVLFITSNWKTFCTESENSQRQLFLLVTSGPNLRHLDKYLSDCDDYQLDCIWKSCFCNLSSDKIKVQQPGSKTTSPANYATHAKGLWHVGYVRHYRGVLLTDYSFYNHVLCFKSFR